MFWTEQESHMLEIAVKEVGEGKWARISRHLCAIGVQRDPNQCRHRWNKVLRPNLKKGCWNDDEDRHLVLAIKQVCARNQNTAQNENTVSLDTSDISWNEVAELVEGRTGKACRERWMGYLSPDVKHGQWDAGEDDILLKLHGELGNTWARIARNIRGRTAEQVKSRYKSIMRRVARENKQRQRCKTGGGDKMTKIVQAANPATCASAQTPQTPQTPLPAITPLPPISQTSSHDTPNASPRSNSSSDGNTSESDDASESELTFAHAAACDRHLSAQLSLDLGRKLSPAPGPVVSACAQARSKKKMLMMKKQHSIEQHTQLQTKVQMQRTLPAPSAIPNPVYSGLNLLLQAATTKNKTSAGTKRKMSLANLLSDCCNSHASSTSGQSKSSDISSPDRRVRRKVSSERSPELSPPVSVATPQFSFSDSNSHRQRNTFTLPTLSQAIAIHL